MNRYMVRVVLHSGNWYNYSVLHARMEADGFSRHIVSNDGRTYQLPDAEYWLETWQDADAVRTMARRAANATGCRYAVLVTSAGLVNWWGLEQVAVPAIV